MPKIGMEFDNLDAAYQFWLAYGAHADFGVRKHYRKKKKTVLYLRVGLC